MKKVFETPSVELIMRDVEDVILTSGSVLQEGGTGRAVIVDLDNL